MLQSPTLSLGFIFPSGHKGTVPVGQSTEEAIVEVPHQIHDVVSTARGTQDHHWWIWTGTTTNPTQCHVYLNWVKISNTPCRFDTIPLSGVDTNINIYFLNLAVLMNILFLSVGHVHLLWLWKVGPEKKGRIYVWVQIPGRQRPAVTEGGQNREREGERLLRQRKRCCWHSEMNSMSWLKLDVKLAFFFKRESE